MELVGDRATFLHDLVEGVARVDGIVLPVLPTEVGKIVSKCGVLKI